MRKWIPSILMCGSSWALALLFVAYNTPPKKDAPTPPESAAIGFGTVTKVDSNSVLTDAKLIEVVIRIDRTKNENTTYEVATLVPVEMTLKPGERVEVSRVEHYHVGMIQMPQFIVKRALPAP